MYLDTFYQSIKNSMDNENYFAEISTSLILIDICSKIEYPNDNKQNRRYKNWINDYYLNTIPENIKNKYLDAENIYFLRNAILHQGSSNPNMTEHYQRYGKEIVNDIIPTVFPTDCSKKVIASASNRSENYPDLFFDIHYFCHSVIHCVKIWEKDNREKIEKNKELLFSIAIAGIDKYNPDKMIIMRKI